MTRNKRSTTKHQAFPEVRQKSIAMIHGLSLLAFAVCLSEFEISEQQTSTSNTSSHLSLLIYLGNDGPSSGAGPFKSRSRPRSLGYLIIDCRVPITYGGTSCRSLPKHQHQAPPYRTNARSSISRLPESHTCISDSTLYEGIPYRTTFAIRCSD